MSYEYLTYNLNDGGGKERFMQESREFSREKFTGKRNDWTSRRLSSLETDLEGTSREATAKNISSSDLLTASMHLSKVPPLPVAGRLRNCCLLVFLNPVLRESHVSALSSDFVKRIGGSVTGASFFHVIGILRKINRASGVYNAICNNSLEQTRYHTQQVLSGSDVVSIFQITWNSWQQ